MLPSALLLFYLLHLTAAKSLTDQCSSTCTADCWLVEDEGEHGWDPACLNSRCNWAGSACAITDDDWTWWANITDYLPKFSQYCDPDGKCPKISIFLENEYWTTPERLEYLRKACNVPDCFFFGRLAYETASNPSKLEELVSGCTTACIEEAGNGNCHEGCFDCKLKTALDCAPSPQDIASVPPRMNVQYVTAGIGPCDSTDRESTVKSACDTHQGPFRPARENGTYYPNSFIDICFREVTDFSNAKGPCVEVCRPWSKINGLGLENCPSKKTDTKVAQINDVVTYCAPGCPNLFLGDGECDPECQTFPCRFDAQDCPVRTCSESPVTQWTISYSTDIFDTSLSCNVEEMTDSNFGNMGYSNPELHVTSTLPFDESQTYIIWEWWYNAYYAGQEQGVVGLVSLNGATKRIAFFLTTYETSKSAEEIFQHRSLTGMVRNPSEENWPQTNDQWTLFEHFFYEYSCLARYVNFALVAYQIFPVRADLDACEWTEVGDGRCDTECLTSECYMDLNDCQIFDCNPVECLSWIGDGICDPKCLNEGCRFDGGDCWCSPDCPYPLLVNGICDESCDNEACFYDFDDCDCSPGCSRYLLSDEECTPECNNPECDYDNGSCLFTLYDDEEGSLDRSTFNALVYHANSNCPTLEPLPSEIIPYDSITYGTEEKDQTPESAKKLVEVLSTYSLYFDQCYASFRIGHYMLTNHDDNKAVFYYECDGADNCDPENCAGSISVENGDCTTASQYDFQIKWENKDD